MREDRQLLAELVGGGDASPSDPSSDALARGALLIARAVDPTIDIDASAQRLQALAGEFGGTTPESLAADLFGSGRFVGNTAAYYEAENSSLPHVLDRGLGIPITLSVLFIEVGRQHGHAIAGVGMPGHFLTSFDGAFYDPFHAGVRRDPEGCRQLLCRMAGRDVQLPPRALEPTPTPMILQRMLWNLRSIAEGSGNGALQFRVLGLLDAFPDVPLQVRMSWANALAERGQFGEAAAVAERAAGFVTGDSAERLRSMAARWLARLN